MLPADPGLPACPARLPACLPAHAARLMRTPAPTPPPAAPAPAQTAAVVILSKEVGTSNGVLVATGTGQPVATSRAIQGLSLGGNVSEALARYDELKELEHITFSLGGTNSTMRVCGVTGVPRRKPRRKPPPRAAAGSARAPAPCCCAR